MIHHLRHARRRSAVVGLTAVAALAALLAGPARPAHAMLRGCSTQGHFETCFTDPSQFSDGTDRTIIDRLRQLVQSTGDGDRIRIAMFGWTLTGIADDVVAAHKRGVDVRVVIDEKNVGNTAYKSLTGGGVPTHVCHDSCLGGSDGHIMHNKFFLFDINGTRSVAQTSFNLAGNQLHKYNNMIRITGDAKLYDFYQGYWNRLNTNSWTYNGVTWSDDDRHRLGSLATKGYVFPRKHDTILGILNNITACSDDGDGDGDGDKKIWVAESLFTKAREGVRNRLAELEDKLGCNVKVVVQTDADENWVQATTSGGYNLDNAKVLHTEGILLHHKFIIVDAKYNGRWQEVVFTGSHNLTGGSLHEDDEAMVRVENPFVFHQYRTHYDGLFAKATN